jgi:D-lyxose ketol-isomerase
MKILRCLLAITLATAAVTLLTGAEKASYKTRKTVKLSNKTFYKADGTLDPVKAKHAYYEMMKKFDYPVYPKLKTDDFWAIDFGLGDFVNVGMAGIFWCNDKKDGYFGHEIYLLPGQMIVEHAHVQTPDAKPKMEAWQVRHGSVYVFGEGEEAKPCPIELPESQAKFITVKNCKLLKAGEIAALNRPEAKHFMIAGPEGAIVTEYATYHDNAGLRFTNPGVKF